MKNAREQAEKYIGWMLKGLDPYLEMKKEQDINKIYTLNDAYNLYMEDRKIEVLTIKRYQRVREVISYVHIKKTMSWRNITSDSQIVNTNIFKGNTSNLKSLIDADLNDISSESISKIHKNITKSHGHGDNDAPSEGDRAIKFIDVMYTKAIQVFNERHDDNNFIKRNPTKLMGKGNWNNPGGHSKRRRESLDTSHIKAHLEGIMALKTFKNTPCEENKNLKYTKDPIPGAVRAHYFLLFLFWTGWRPGDVALIEWDQIETDEGIVTVSWNDKQAVERLKTNEPIYKVPLNHQAVAVINELRELKEAKMKAVENGDLVLPKDYDDKRIFLNVLENSHVKSNQFFYETKIAEISNVKHYPTGIYRKTFLSYGSHLNINIYTLKRLVFHTQNYYDVTSGYIHTHREVLLRASERICSFILSIVNPVKYEVPIASDSKVEVKIDEDVFNEMNAQFANNTEKKCSDFIRIALALKSLSPDLFNKINSTTTENAEFEDSDFYD